MIKRTSKVPTIGSADRKEQARKVAHMPTKATVQPTARPSNVPVPKAPEPLELGFEHDSNESCKGPAAPIGVVIPQDVLNPEVEMTEAQQLKQERRENSGGDGMPWMRYDNEELWDGEPVDD